MSLEPDFQILRPIVSFVAILVMDHFMRHESAAYLLFHYHPMLKDPLPLVLHPDIAAH